MHYTKIPFTKGNATLLAFCGLFLSGCMAEAPLPYGPRSQTGVGYQDRELAPHKYEIQVVGYSTTPHSQLEDFFHRRAAELCNGPESYTTNIGAGYIKGRTLGSYNGLYSSGPRAYQQSIITGVATCK